MCSYFPEETLNILLLDSFEIKLSKTTENRQKQKIMYLLAWIRMSIYILYFKLQCFHIHFKKSLNIYFVFVVCLMTFLVERICYHLRRFSFNWEKNILIYIQILLYPSLQDNQNKPIFIILSFSFQSRVTCFTWAHFK